MSHTPGPWHYYDNGFDGGVVNGWRLCDDRTCGQHYFEDKFGKPRQHYDEWIVGGEPHEGRLQPDDPNVALIAAAPDLLAALEHVSRFDAHHPDRAWAEELALVFDAIAKAHGAAEVPS